MTLLGAVAGCHCLLGIGGGVGAHVGGLDVVPLLGVIAGCYWWAPLLADLSKAFERVNSHWILHLRRIKHVPKGVIAYTRFTLFNRRVSHKVQGRLLPSRTILQGVDMGRSFSVFFPKAAAKGSFEKSVAIKDCHQSSAEVMAVFKDCNQTLPKVLLE